MRYNLHSLVPLDKLESGKCPIPLFHGTDAALLAMSESERNYARLACNRLIDYAYPVVAQSGLNKLLPANVPEDKLFTYRYLVSAYVKATGKKQGLSWFEYDSTYMTFDPEKAEQYAKNSYIFGETGFMAYWLYTGALGMGYSMPAPSEEELKAIDFVLKAKEREPRPIVLMFTNIAYNRIKKEDGKDIQWAEEFDNFCNHMNIGSVRISGDIDLAEGIRIDLESLPTIE